MQINFAETAGGDFEQEVTCPYCTVSPYVYPTRIRINAGGQITTVTARGVSVQKGTAEGRGVRFETQYYCESCGRIFTHKYQFHKGETLVTCSIDNHCVSVDQNDQRAQVIWRD